MNPKSNVIEISSDSSFDSTYDLPQIRRAYNTIGEGPSEVNPSSASLEETLNPTPLAVILPSFTPFTEFLTSEMERVVADMSKISVPVEPQSSQRGKGPLKVVLGLAAPKLWDKDMQSRGVHKRMPDPKDKDMGKGKRKME